MSPALQADCYHLHHQGNIIQIYRFTTILIKILMTVFAATEKPIPGSGEPVTWALGCCLSCFASVASFFGASMSEQNSLANLFYLALGVPHL